MDQKELLALIAQGENESVEFKRCGQQPDADTFESLCAFANGFGGTLLLGVGDDGQIIGIEPSRVLSVNRNIINVVNNPNAFDIPVPLDFEQITIDGKIILKINVINSPQIHSYKGKVYARRGDCDVAIRGSLPLAEFCIRKQNILTEQRVFEHVDLDDLRSDLIDKARSLALIKRADHPWGTMNNRELVESAGFVGKDYNTAKTGVNLAGILMLGTDEVIRSLCPTYKTDALVRIHDTERYDDRLTSSTNLMDSYEELSGFCRRHLPDRFALDGDQAISPRDAIVRELVVNCLVHREFTSPFPAKIIIDPYGIRTENASRASFEGPLEPDTFNPLPKNPLIAGFFSHIGRSEELGSGVRKLFQSSRLYTGRDPELEEGVIFHAFVPTNPAPAPISASTETSAASVPKAASSDSVLPSDIAEAALFLAATEKGLHTADLEAAGHARRTAQRVIRELVAQGKLVSSGNGRGRVYRSGKLPDQS